jgi:hypothetical protein
MDPFDEFEFKPLTDGLGFHKKKATTPVQTPNTIPQSATSTRRASFEEEAIENLLPPLKRKSTAIETATIQDNSNSTVDEILKTLRQNQRLDFETSKKVAKKTTTADEYVATNWNLSSTFLDTMLIVAASLLCMIVLLVITKADLIVNLTHPDDSGMIYVATLTMFAGVTFIYMLVNRVFLGATPGEWAFDQRIGKPEEMLSPLYALKIAARCLLVMCTGFILMPILSLIMGRDIAGSITGAALYRKV